MAISISDFKSAFNGGTRSNRFLVSGVIPGNGVISKFHIATTLIPSMSSQRIEYNYFGRKAYYPGEKQYTPWSVMILDDTSADGNLWKKFSNWHNTINNHETNNSFLPTIASDYKANNWTVNHLNLNGEANPHKSFIMHGCWPKTIEPIQFSMTSPNTLVKFSVVIMYDWIEMTGITDVVPES